MKKKTWKLTDDQMRSRKAGRRWQWTPEQLTEFARHRLATEVYETVPVFTDGASDSELLSFLAAHDTGGLTKEEVNRLSERLAQRRIGLTLEQKKRLQFLTNGEFKIEVEEHGF